MRPPAFPATLPLAARLASTLSHLDPAQLPQAVSAKVKVCLMDLIGCACESLELPWSRQAQALAVPVTAGTAHGATIIGSEHRVAAGDAAFANAVMGHGLVREDMHAGSFSHLGIVVLPALLALAQTRRISGRDFIAAATCGYEVGGKLGRAVMDPALARIFRPTGIWGPLAGAAAASRALGLDEDRATSALGLATNMVAGYNQWAHTGGSEMFFQAGNAARNALAAARLAELGAYASPSALEGEGGLFAALGRNPDLDGIVLFGGAPEILSVYHKPVPACNFAQTACQAALRVGRVRGSVAARIAHIEIRVPHAAAQYPGCDCTGPFQHVLQAKMSIQYNVAAALLRGEVSEANFTLLEDPALHHLLGLMTLVVDDGMTRAFPRQQGAEVVLTLSDGTTQRAHLDDVQNASADEVRARFSVAVASVLGTARAAEIENCIETLDTTDDAGRLGGLLGVM